MSALVRTVRGDLDPAELGVTNAHDHLFIASPRLPGQELDDPAAAETELAAFAALGGRTVVQWTPWGMAPRTGELPALADRTGVHIIAATGLHQAHHYDPGELAAISDRLADLFVHDLTAAPVRAGLIKIAGAYHRLDRHAEHVLAAAAQAHHVTDAPIGVHLEAGTAALEVLAALCDRHGVPPHRVLLGHAHRFPDRRIHRQAAETGAYLVFDGPNRVHHGTDALLLDSLAALVDTGHTARIMLGADTVTRAARSTKDGPGMPFLLSGLRPRIDRELGADIATAIFVTNPARAFAADWRG